MLLALLYSTYNGPSWLPVVVFGFPVIIFLTRVAYTLRPEWFSRITARPIPDADEHTFTTYVGILQPQFSYFRLLNDAEQKEFVSRVYFIHNEKIFTGIGLDVTDEMKILVSASLVQLTFGIIEFDLDTLEEIQLAPGTFYSPLVGRNVKGLTFVRGKIILSWADFVEGYRIDNDKLNLGLHELAHAMWIDYFDHIELHSNFEEMTHVALQELQRDRTGNTFLRDYASSNIEEFWACSVECFFEVPIDFSHKIPDLYHKISEVLNQDMVARVQRKGSMVAS